MSTRNACAGLLLPALALLACDRSPVTPDDASVRLLSDRREIAPDSQTTVRALLSFADGSIAGRSWDVDFVVTGGTFGDSLVALRRGTDGNGVVTVVVRAGRIAGPLIVRAKSGAASAIDTLTIVAPADSSRTAADSTKPPAGLTSQ